MRVLKTIPNIYFDYHHSISGEISTKFLKFEFIAGESNFLNEFFEKKKQYFSLKNMWPFIQLSFFANINLLSFCKIIQQEKEVVFVFQY